MTETVEAHKETMDFQAEVAQVLHLMIHSLYSNKEIFLRELISNASDAADKLRFEALQNDALYEDDSELKIRISFDKDARTVTISDNGIGMSRAEVQENIGTIARSGTRQFLDSLTGDQARDSHLIGQFGVGFYSSFIIADKVTLSTRRAGEPASAGVRWESSGEGSYSLESIDRPTRGTEVVLHLREGEDEFLAGYRLRSIVHKFSDHISLPIVMDREAEPAAEGEQEKEQSAPEEETVNQASALWTRPKAEITEEEYKEFYKHVSHDFEDPLAWAHNRVEGKSEYISLLYIPARAPFDLWDRERRHGVKLYVQRVFIMDDTEHLMPQYLRFVRGVIDSSDLPLNVSRELLQQNKLIDSIRGASVKRVLGMLENMASEDGDNYAKLWGQFGRVIKEGPAEDFGNRERIAKLLRFSTTHTDKEEQTVSLEDYVGRMKDGQESIYYITAESFAAARNSPHLEVFRKKGIEALLLCDRVDEWLVSSLTEFDGKSLQSVAKGDLDLGKLEDEVEKKEKESAEKELGELVKRVKDVLEERVKDVRLTNRLTASPACIVADQYDMGGNLERILKSVGQDVPHSKPILELNPDHPLVRRLGEEGDESRFGDLANILFDQAYLSEGGQLEDPVSFVHRLNELLLDLADKAKG
jgi:molecular chaperone HtpG